MAFFALQYINSTCRNSAAHKSIRRDKQNPYFRKEIVENTDLQLHVRNCLWNIWETPFTPLRKVSFDVGPLAGISSAHNKGMKRFTGREQRMQTLTHSNI
jgi:hypothetical protein